MRLQEIRTSDTDKMDFYFTGRDALNALYGALESANESILLEFFIFDNDETGRRFRDLLVRKALQGLKVMVCCDSFGSIGSGSKFFRTMKNAGIRVSIFNPLFTVFGMIHFNHRNHRKLVVIDGKVSFVGGVNIADRYFYGGKYALWRDTFTKITSPSTADKLSYVFYNDFNHIYKSSALVGEEWLKAKIASAKVSVKIMTPYFAPSREMYKVIASACMRGVDVHLMIPMRTDSDILHYNNMASVKYALKIGMKVHLFYNGFNHSKVFAIDDIVAYVGSANMDNRSLRLDFEVMAEITSAQYVEMLLNRYERDIRYSRTLLSMSDWSDRTKRSVLYERLARMLYRFL